MIENGMDNRTDVKMLCVVGPTASGKSALAVQLAKALDGEVISCDSMQLYRGMDIGTAKSTQEEMDGIPLHLTDVFDIHEPFCVTDYTALAEEAVRDVASRGHVPIFCGGTGLYIDTFVKGLAIAEYDNVPGVREELEAYAKKNGAAALHDRLRDVDPASADAIEPNNVRRVVRALEVYRSTGVPASELNRRSVENARPKRALYIGLAYHDRAALYERIDRRVDVMMSAGLLDETKRLVDCGLRETKTAGQAIGYKEFYPYLDGEASLDECVAVLKAHSRQYAKRQMTWFTRNPAVHFLYRDELDDTALSRAACTLADDFLAAE